MGKKLGGVQLRVREGLGWARFAWKEKDSLVVGTSLQL